MAHGGPEACQPGQAPSEQCHPAYSMPDRDAVIAQRYLDPVFHDVS